MTKFNPENKETLTCAEALDPAMEITEQDDADQYFRGYVAHIQKALDREPRSDNATAEDIARANLGYYAGYYGHKTRERVERLFKCAHPIFGAVAVNGAPTPEEAFTKGLELGRNAPAN